jgi:hypothetical protein
MTILKRIEHAVDFVTALTIVLVLSAMVAESFDK